MLRADSSYTAFRGDMIMTWAGAFYPMQKLLERTFADHVAVKALTWGQRKGFVPMLPAGWEQSLSWQWPRMAEVDTAKQQTAIAQAIKNGVTDWSQLIGPDWMQHFDALAQQIEYARAKGIPLSNMETKSGGAIAPASEEKDGTDEQN